MRPSFLHHFVAISLSSWVLVATAWTAEDSNRTMFGNRAVQKELRLTIEQQRQFDELLAELERQIADQSARVEQEIRDPEQLAEQKDEIENKLIRDYGNRLLAVLNQQQANRFWQIGEQSHPHLTFNNNRVRRVLKLSAEQIAKMEEIVGQFGDELRKLATDPEVSLENLQLHNRRAQRECFETNRQLLTDEQRQKLDELLGEPFDQKLLTLADGERPRSLTFVFTLTGRNGFVLLNSPKLQRELKISDEQNQQIQELLKQYDQDLTAVRLGTLKALPKDFADLGLEEKRSTAISILDKTVEIHDRTATAIAKVLSKQQWEQLEREIVRAVNARAIECPAIATRLELTKQQMATFTKLRSDFHQQIAPLLVVRRLDQFDEKTFDDARSKFTNDLQAILTEAQAAKLSEIAGDAK